MYVTIDLEKLIFVHNVDKMTAAAHLAWIEMHTKKYAVDCTDSKSWLSYMTDLEMKMLYRNTTGVDTYYAGAYLRSILSQLAETLDENEYNILELSAQAALVNDGDAPGYEYCYGAMKPARPEQFVIEALTGQKVANEAALAAARASRYSAPVRAMQAAHKPAPATLAATGATGAQARTSAPRSGSVRDTIWEVANTIWEKEGKPSDKQIVMKLRKVMMDILEKDHEVKRNSSSNELGNWMKQNIC